MFGNSFRFPQSELYEKFRENRTNVENFTRTITSINELPPEGGRRVSVGLAANGFSGRRGERARGEGAGSVDSVVALALAYAQKTHEVLEGRPLGEAGERPRRRSSGGLATDETLSGVFSPYADGGGGEWSRGSSDDRVAWELRRALERVEGRPRQGSEGPLPSKSGHSSFAPSQASNTTSAYSEDSTDQSLEMHYEC